MKVILVGYPGSQHLVPASKYLTSKYLPGFDITYLNYEGPIEGWAAYVREYMRGLTDERIIFALDDYLISAPINLKKFEKAKEIMDKDPFCACVKLCYSTPEEHDEYPVTTQYSLWDREYLIRLLGVVETPWEFEIKGSGIHKMTEGKSNSWYTAQLPCLEYDPHSALSGRWEGINITGLNNEDIQHLQTTHLLPTQGQVSTDTSSTDKIVVFGGSGYLGTALIGRLIAEGHKNIVSVSRNEGNLVTLKQKFPLLQIIVGDIADSWVCKSAMTNAKQVYLLSAMKHVGLAEQDVRSCMSTNVLGTMNVINESLITKPRSLVFISSDKAAQGTGIYGASKKIGERLMAEAGRINADTKYRVIRYGNVWGSTGSIVTKWKPKMEAGEEVILTDPEASRFFWTVDEAVDLIFQCLAKATDATPYVPTMKAVSMGTVLEACMHMYCLPGRESPIKIIGLQPGENKFETMDGVTYSNEVEQFSKEEFMEKFLNYKTVHALDLAEDVLKRLSKNVRRQGKISCVLITRGEVYPEIILERLDIGDFFDEIIIIPNCRSIFDRYRAAAGAKNDTIYVQDDDCLVNYKKLYEHYDGRITNAMPLAFQKKYEGKGTTLVGWGCFFPRSIVNDSMTKYLQMYGEDEHMVREADRIFTHLNQPWNTVTMPHEDLFQDGTRMGDEPYHYTSAEEALAKAALIK